MEQTSSFPDSGEGSETVRLLIGDHRTDELEAIAWYVFLGGGSQERGPPRLGQGEEEGHFNALTCGPNRHIYPFHTGNGWLIGLVSNLRNWTDDGKYHCWKAIYHEPRGAGFVYTGIKQGDHYFKLEDPRQKPPHSGP